MWQQRYILSAFFLIQLLLTACGSSESEEIPEYKPPEDRLKFSVAPYESPVGTVFTYEDKYARRVTIAGDFNNWNPLLTPLTRNKYGIWETIVPLKRGVYAYKFNVDGQWIPDPRNFKKATDQAGDLKSVMFVTNGIDRYYRPVAEGYARAFPPTHRSKGVEFSYSSLDSSRVSLGGEFNQWSKTRNPMTMNRNGIWTVLLPLDKGRYRYKFCVDGQWVQDPENPVTEPDETGGRFSIVAVTNNFPDPSMAPHAVDRVPVKFHYKSRTLPSRIRIAVVGDWNNWDDTLDSLSDPDQDKIWEGVVYVRPGQFLYRFKIRAEEFPDPLNTRIETAPDGRPASRIEIFIPPDRMMIRFSYRPITGNGNAIVHLTGDFNNWDLENDPMEWDSEHHIWFRVMDLPVGTYRYQFRVGNRSEIDPANSDMVEDANGVAYSVLTVPIK